jgi:hypothetical protein
MAVVYFKAFSEKCHGRAEEKYVEPQYYLSLNTLSQDPVK